MLSYCLKSRKITESKNPNIGKIEYWRIVLPSSFVVCNSKRFEFNKEQEASGFY